MNLSKLLKIAAIEAIETDRLDCARECLRQIALIDRGKNIVIEAQRPALSIVPKAKEAKPQKAISINRWAEIIETEIIPSLGLNRGDVFTTRDLTGFVRGNLKARLNKADNKMMGKGVPRWASHLYCGVDKLQEKGLLERCTGHHGIKILSDINKTA